MSIYILPMYGALRKASYLFANVIKRNEMLVLQDCINKLANFKVAFRQKYCITKQDIFGSVARNENTENSDIGIVVEVQKPSLKLMYELKEAFIFFSIINLLL